MEMNQFYKAVLACFIVFLLTSCNESFTNTQPDKLVVKRLDPLHQSDIGFEKSIEDKAEVKKLYDKMLSLPSFPQGTTSCPADNGVQYELTFTHESKSVSKAMVSATGCQGVTLNEKTYWAMEPKGNGFRALLEQVIGLIDNDFRVGFVPETAEKGL
jgi:hypothetical protein